MKTFVRQFWTALREMAGPHYIVVWPPREVARDLRRQLSLRKG